MDDFRGKIRDFVGTRNQMEAAKILGISQPFLALILSGKRTPRVSKLKQIMDRIALASPAPAPIPPASPLPYAIRIIDPYSFSEPELRAREAEYQAVPLYEAAVVGGPPEEVYSEKAKGIAFIPAKTLHKKDPQKLACFEVKGESMFPVVRRGATVCVDLSVRPERSGDKPAKAPKDSIWVVRKDDGLVVKYIRIKDGVIVLVSANPAEDVDVVANPEAVVGQVIYVAQGM